MLLIILDICIEHMCCSSSSKHVWVEPDMSFKYLHSETVIDASKFRVSCVASSPKWWGKWLNISSVDCSKIVRKSDRIKKTNLLIWWKEKERNPTVPTVWTDRDREEKSERFGEGEKNKACMTYIDIAYKFRKRNKRSTLFLFHFISYVRNYEPTCIVNIKMVTM